MNQKDKVSKVLKIAIGSTLAILLAEAMGLSYGVSAGIITLLTIQDTKKETLLVSIRRVAAFFLAVILAFFVFHMGSYHSITYGIFLLVFVGSCYLLKMEDAIPINAVLATHYLLEKNMTLEIVRNELLLLVIGAGIGTIINLYMPSIVKQIRSEQKVIEEDIRMILSRMAAGLLIIDKSEYKGNCFIQLEEHILKGLKHAYTNMNNSFFQETKYYIEYMEMRKQQSRILKEIYEKIIEMNSIPSQAYEVAEFMKQIGERISESQNAKELLEIEGNLLEKLKESSLPVTREEFEDRAILYMILKNFSIFLKMKEGFSDSLTEEQKHKYWSNERESEREV